MCNKCRAFLNDYLYELVGARTTYMEYLRRQALRSFVPEWLHWILFVLEKMPYPQFLMAQGLANNPMDHFLIFKHLLERNPWFQKECEYLATRMIEQGIVSLKEKEIPSRVIEFYLADTLPPMLRCALEAHYCHSQPEKALHLSFQTAPLPVTVAMSTLTIALPLQQDEEDLYV